jgi:hypothetical protein
LCEERAQVSHRDLLVAANIDASDENDVDLHGGSRP